MKYLDEFRDSRLALALAAKIARESTRPVSFMEFCGGHTVSIHRYGIARMLPKQVRLLSGPGCPVCVTPMEQIDWIIALSREPGVVVASYGDMLRVPGSRSSLIEERGRGAQVRIVYSSYEAVELAAAHPELQVVFFGIGFETTAPATAAAVVRAREENLPNFSVVSAHKTTPGVITALLDSGDLALDGLICPGHVSVVTGIAPYQYAAERRGVPCVISGFEPLDILQSIGMLVAQVEEGRAAVEIQYRRGVRPEGNLKARALLERVFEPADSNWRGLGPIPGTGLALRPEFSAWDALARFSPLVEPTREPAGCICGRVLRGVASPRDCALFGKRCQPESPVGACMVSSEGACQAHYRWSAVEG